MATEDTSINQQPVVKFGIGQLSNPTPIAIKYVFRALAFLSGVWALLPQDLLMLSDHDYGQVNRWLIVLNAIVLFATKFFGWDTKEVKE